MMTIFASKSFTVILGGVLLLLVMLLWISGAVAGRVRLLVFKLAIFLLFLRFAVPVMAFVGEGMFRLFLEEQYVASTEHIEQTAEEIGMINESREKTIPTLPDETLMDKVKRFYESATTRMDIQDYIERYKAAAADASEHAVNLIVIFIIQTMFFPLLFLWGLVRGFRSLMSLKVLAYDDRI
ncbi:hypothetical protein GWO43_15690 [candidate division KSB1 bacterium]|nr:hypothetical protein [candidate division KSB1 bacterium]NIT72285.1 hypothetical protein [candidate division KSB1 bacterium]NIX71965.1 hypothetical protein [candidate division KSB1 bacterium]